MEYNIQHNIDNCCVFETLERALYIYRAVLLHGVVSTVAMNGQIEHRL